MRSLQDRWWLLSHPARPRAGGQEEAARLGGFEGSQALRPCGRARCHLAGHEWAAGPPALLRCGVVPEIDVYGKLTKLVASPRRPRLFYAPPLLLAEASSSGRDSGGVLVLSPAVPQPLLLRPGKKVGEK